MRMNAATAQSPPYPPYPPHPPQSPPWPRPAPATASNDEVPRHCLLRVLVVDDDLGSIEYLGRLLKGFAQISFATNGGDALRLARLQRPDVALVDVGLPGGDGFEVCRRLRATPGLQDLPVIFAIQHGDARSEAEALQLGGGDCLAKPFDDLQVLSRLRRQLRAAATPAPAPVPDDAVAAARRATASMLSYIAHEIGNPVNVIQGFAQLMQAAPLPAGQAEKLSHILEAVERLRGLLGDVSDVARLESGQFQVESTQVELGDFVQQACRAAVAQAAQAGVRVNLPATRHPVLVQADARRLRQCLDNLLSNALKYGSGGGRIDVEIEVGGDEVLLAVQDHGAGLGASQLRQLFEPYNRLGHDGGAIPGTGLGLTLTRQLMRAMGGHLRVHSAGAGQGCRFELLLRAATG